MVNLYLLEVPAVLEEGRGRQKIKCQCHSESFVTDRYFVEPLSSVPVTFDGMAESPSNFLAECLSNRALFRVYIGSSKQEEG